VFVTVYVLQLRNFCVKVNCNVLNIHLDTDSKLLHLFVSVDMNFVANSM